MSETIAGPLTVNLKEGEMICAAGEHDSSLFIVHSGKLMVFVNKGSQITPVAYLEDGEYLGELSFFDQRPRSAHVVALEETSLIKIPEGELHKQLPPWLSTIAVSMAEKLRRADDLIQKKGIRKKNVDSIAPLSIEEQTHYYHILQEYLEELN
jgi:CRP/FNR family transcriptional regulator, cyclic AMP receptor protein